MLPPPRRALTENMARCFGMKPRKLTGFGSSFRQNITYVAF